MNTMTGGIVSLGPPVGVIVDAHLVSSIAPNIMAKTNIAAEAMRPIVWSILLIILC
jgi:hypothetical protein